MNHIDGEFTKLFTNNRMELESAEKCGCFNCLKIFSPIEIVEWLDGGMTACCPFCGIDSVIAESNEVKLDYDMLKAINTKMISSES